MLQYSQTPGGPTAPGAPRTPGGPGRPIGPLSPGRPVLPTPGGPGAPEDYMVNMSLIKCTAKITKRSPEIQKRT